jgi:CHAT domain-containing protein
LAEKYTGEQYQRFAANTMLRWKRFFSEETARLYRKMNLDQHSEVVRFKNKISRLRSELSQHWNTKSDQELSSLLEQLNNAEKGLLALSKTFQRNLAVKEVSYDLIAKNLPQKTCLVDYSFFQPVDFKTGKTGERHLAGLLIISDSGSKRKFVFQDLGPMSKVIGWDMLYEKELDPSWYNWLLGPFDDFIRDVKQLYVAPDYYLNVFSFASLTLPDGRFLAERQQISRLQTGRDLLAGKKNVPSGKGLIAVGGIDYVPLNKTNKPNPLADSRVAQQLRNGIAPLKQSSPEVQTIGEIFRSNTGENPQIFLGKNASEHSLKKLGHSPRILHLSTHGFFLEGDAQRGMVDESPFLLSGLAFSGANNALRGKLDKHGEDGLLYSMEVLSLNLQGTELVSLSACDTGTGVVDYFEGGVYGLVRAFRTAGAQNVLMTLTPVGDQASREFMETFYDNWLGSPDNITPTQALHKTRLDFIHHKKPAYRNSKVWSPYVMVGR